MSQTSISSQSSPLDSDRKSRKQQRRPPQRLSWPASLSQSSNVSNSQSQVQRGSSVKKHVNFQSDDIVSRKITGRKRSRASIPSPSKRYNGTKPISYDDDTDNKGIMWVDKFAPKASNDLCVAPKKVKEIKQWIQESFESFGNNKNKLLVLIGSPGVGKSTAVRVLSHELNLSILSWNESLQPRTQEAMDPRSIFAMEQLSALDSLHQFLQQSGTGFTSLNMSSTSFFNDNGGRKSVILLEDLPNLHGIEAEHKFRSIMNRHLQRSNVPTILIFSDVSEGKHKPEDLERLIEPDDLYDNERTTILQIHGVTKPKMKKVLTTIAKHERCELNPNFWEEIHSHSHGDLRHAIMTLQLQATGTNGLGAGRNYLQGGKNERDTKLSTFHSLGKILYGKRTIIDGHACLAFDPEAILERSDLGLEGSLRFLEYHSIDFFTDVTDVSTAYSFFSDAIELLDRSDANGGDGRNHIDVGGAHAYQCASAVAGRAVANTNRHPAPNKFRQFSRPKVFDVIRNGRQNQILVDQLSRRLATYHLTSPTILGGSAGTFVTESLPFVRSIIPQEVDPIVNNLYSAAMQHQRGRQKSASKEDDFGLKEQKEILETDDIVDFDSDDDD